MTNLYRRPSIDASYQDSVHLAKRFQTRSFLRNRPIRNKNCLWWPCLSTDRDEISDPYRVPPIDASCHVSVQLAMRFQRRFLRNQPIRNKNCLCLWWPCLLMDRFCNLQKGPSIDASYQALVHLAKRFQRRYFRNRPIRNKNCLWRPCLLTNRNEMRNLYRGPSIDASYQDSVHLAKRFQTRSFLEINRSETRIACGGHVCQRIERK